MTVCAVQDNDRWSVTRTLLNQLQWACEFDDNEGEEASDVEYEDFMDFTAPGATDYGDKVTDYDYEEFQGIEVWQIKRKENYNIENSPVLFFLFFC